MGSGGVGDGGAMGVAVGVRVTVGETASERRVEVAGAVAVEEGVTVGVAVPVRLGNKVGVAEMPSVGSTPAAGSRVRGSGAAGVGEVVLVDLSVRARRAAPCGVETGETRATSPPGERNSAACQPRMRKPARARRIANALIVFLLMGSEPVPSAVLEPRMMVDHEIHYPLQELPTAAAFLDLPIWPDGPWPPVGMVTDNRATAHYQRNNPS